MVAYYIMLHLDYQLKLAPRYHRTLFLAKTQHEELHKIEQSIEQESGQKPLIVGLSKWSIASALRFLRC